MTLVTVEQHEGEDYLIYDCPGCGHTHSVPAKRWNWNGSVDSPTLHPSVRHYIPVCEDHPQEETICHYHIVNGEIRYCPDCRHSLAGKTVPLPPRTLNSDHP